MRDLEFWHSNEINNIANNNSHLISPTNGLELGQEMDLYSFKLSSNNLVAELHFKVTPKESKHFQAVFTIKDKELFLIRIFSKTDY